MCIGLLICLSFEEISLVERILNSEAVKKNDMITKYLSNIDLYFLLQVNKLISNTVRPKFMKYRKKEQVIFLIFFLSN